jgi:hypothetical protein
MLVRTDNFTVGKFRLLCVDCIISATRRSAKCKHCICLKNLNIRMNTYMRIVDI